MSQGRKSQGPWSQVSESQDPRSRSLGSQGPGSQDPGSQGFRVLDLNSQGPESLVSGPGFRLCHHPSLYKKNNRHEKKNYRPVSIISVISKILANVVFMIKSIKALAITCLTSDGLPKGI